MNTVPESNMTRSERMAARIMRALAVVGLVSILALTAWLLVVGIRTLPHSTSKLGAGVSYVTSLFKGTPDESLSFSLPSTTFVSGAPGTLAWSYEGTSDLSVFGLSYACADGVTFSVFGATGWTDLACNTPLTVKGTSLTFIPTAKLNRFNDVRVTVTAGSLSDEHSLSIVNTTLPSALPAAQATSSAGVAKPSTPVEPPASTTSSSKAPKPVVIQPTAPAYKPADLAVAITDTGVLADVSGRSTFFSITPIPSTKTGAVKFTVTNQGTVQSSAWAFIVYLPVNGENAYKYVSPVQAALNGGTQVEFTLGFDELNEDSSGTIRVDLKPTDSGDLLLNNTDLRQIVIK